MLLDPILPSVILFLFRWTSLPLESFIKGTYFLLYCRRKHSVSLRKESIQTSQMGFLSLWNHSTEASNPTTINRKLLNLRNNRNISFPLPTNPLLSPRIATLQIRKSINPIKQPSMVAHRRTTFNDPTSNRRFSLRQDFR